MKQASAKLRSLKELGKYFGLEPAITEPEVAEKTAEVASEQGNGEKEFQSEYEIIETVEAVKTTTPRRAKDREGEYIDIPTWIKPHDYVNKKGEKIHVDGHWKDGVGLPTKRVFNRHWYVGKSGISEESRIITATVVVQKKSIPKDGLIREFEFANIIPTPGVEPVCEMKFSPASGKGIKLGDSGRELIFPALKPRKCPVR
jgi:hypothetical protein